MFTTEARHLAVRATVVFTTAAVAGALTTVHDWPTAAPLLGFHTLLLVNTYFSIRCFSSIGLSQSAAQFVTDAVLLALYVLLPFQFADSMRYLEASVALFLIANVKYALMLGTPAYAQRLGRKMALNVLAAIGCGLALTGVAAGVPQSLGCLLTVFLLRNIYVLLVSKMYFPLADPAPSP